MRGIYKDWTIRAYMRMRVQKACMRSIISILSSSR